MQQIVKVFIPEMLVDIFPGITLKTEKTGFVHYNIHVIRIDGEELQKLANVHKETNVDVFIYRYGKGMTIKVVPKDGWETMDYEIN